MDRTSFVATARSALDLASRPEVAAAWSVESACAGMSVGGLTYHLLQQVVHTGLVLESPAVRREVVGVHDHYARAEWVGADLDAPANVGVRERSDALAGDGPEAVLGRGRDALDRVVELLADPDAPAVVSPAWLSWSLMTEDYLLTRLVELTVHSDDLAASVALPTPLFGDDVVADVLGVLTAVSVRRHGQTAVLRALSRPQRAPWDVSAF
ncbi:hypothetical protein EQW78_09585 [Oerskovia turbata]|uniref:Mycothiol-dependent maleylpyruvate isomerase metal-binding domain-containing protein n=1 Tax=Oerskovia turbata TaxID=1713 RepID=A0A4Q1KWP1_9CELL|nr:maleylpyruvate isomerase N-terminal domain-containing protein [Oerskovia turbata]RXR25491.1 hypothetical protein EQW73_11730 [Oerskovia turbata]RXR33869.1 hypothetical protein EQW78_09585 [Oerskovia turbata]TGJ95746.1 hypothetical protein DLJ96_14715 [Actinotalea fermentans ATCC 43279 = JCM 9966 = DSM 3133]